MRALPLTAAAFAPYGAVIESAPETPGTGAWINDGHAWASPAGPLALDGGARLRVFRCRAREAAGPWRVLERHRLGSQSFLPLGGAACLILVARGDLAPDPATLAAFVSAPGQGWTLAPGTWHHALIALDDVDVAVLERAASGSDCDLAHLDPPLAVVL